MVNVFKAEYTRVKSILFANVNPFEGLLKCQCWAGGTKALLNWVEKSLIKQPPVNLGDSTLCDDADDVDDEDADDVDVKIIPKVFHFR